MKNNKKGSAWPVVLVIVLLIALFIGYRMLRMHWLEFKARAGFTTTLLIIAAVIIIVIILYIYIRLRIRKARKEKEKKKREEESSAMTE